ncbi:MAG: hypothetical protein IT370_10165 [Deltaproteobacteria bacterium]|nr:hypothetical protein [Deltaproteobacteria bacterium]
MMETKKKRTRSLLVGSALVLTTMLGGCLGGADDEGPRDATTGDEVIIASNPKGCFFDGGIYCPPPLDAGPDSGGDAGDGG